MGFFSLLAALLIEQFRPLSYQRVVLQPFSRLLDSLRAISGAHDDYAVLVIWLVLVPGAVVVTGVIYLALHSASPMLAWIWTVAILYLTMGFRQFSHYFSDIHLALRMDESEEAKQLLDEWNGTPTDCTSTSDIAKKAIEKALTASHHHVFAVLAWFIILPGPCGAVLYRAASCFAEAACAQPASEDDSFAYFARKAFSFIDWIPLRLTAFCYAIVGNFEDAMYSWRNQNDTPSEPDNIILASGAGALGISLGESASSDDEPSSDEPITVNHMQSTVGLLWRTLVLWLLLLLLLVFARLTTG